jgi:selenide,water dikinase
MGPEALAQVLRPLREMFLSEKYPNLLVGLEKSDDAAVYKISEDAAIIQTLDFFPPIVDDPYDYGAIAAANAMSDVYAMGGEVVLALNICGFPHDMNPAIIAEILRGGAEKVAEADAILAGGHTLDDKEPKYGLAVMGLVHPERVVTREGAKPGDVLVLTKPLGVGIITTALKGQVADPSHVEGAVRSMSKLNRKASQLMQEVGVNACSDITGFSILGHAQEMASLSGVGMRFYIEKIPFLEGAMDYAKEWLFPGGACRNQNYYSPWIRFSPDIPEEVQKLLFTPETSGGLLIAVSHKKLDEMIYIFTSEEQPLWIVGEIIEDEGIEVVRNH